MLNILYQIMKQYHSFVVQITAPGVLLTCGSCGTLTCQDDRITGENLTIRNIESFSVRKDRDNPGILNIFISESIIISCI